VKAPRGDKLLDALKAYAPKKLVAYMSESDEDGKAVAVPDNRKRWSRVVATLDKLAWCRLDLLDKNGGLLYRLDNAEPASELEELPTSKAMGEHALALRIAELATKHARDAVEQALGNRDSEMKALMTGHAAVLKEMSAAMGTLTAAYRELADVKEESAETRAEAELAAQAAASGFNMKELLEAMPVLMQALPALKALLSGGAPSAPNGHSKRG
jgi:hypothetical protein